MQEQCVCTVLVYRKKTNKTFVFNALSNNQKKARIVKYRDSPHLTCLISPAKPKGMSTLDNLIEAARTTLVLVGGLAKPHRPATLALVEVTTLDTKQLFSMLGDSMNSRPSYLSRLLPSTLDNLFRPQTDSELGGLCTIQGPPNTYGKLCGTLIHTLAFHLCPSTEAHTSSP